MEFAQERAGDVADRRNSPGGSTAVPPSPPRTASRGLIGDGAPRLAVDLSKLEYISSAGLRVLLVVAKKVQQAKGKVVLFGLAPNVREVFSISGFDQIFSIRARRRGRRRGGAVRRPAMLGFVEEIVLLQLDDRRGRFIDLPLSAADVVLAGAALMELALRNKRRHRSRPV